MATFIWPSGFNNQQEFLPQIIARDTTLGVDSPIRAFLIKRGINLVQMNADSKEAKTHDGKRIDFEGKSKQSIEQRNALFNPIWKTTQLIFQALKDYYGEEHYASVQDFGAEVVTDGKMLYPSDFASKAIIVEKLIAKQNSFTDPAVPSPLAAYIKANKVDFKEIDNNLLAAVKANSDAKTFKDNAEKETSLRNKLWLPVYANIKLIAGNLSATYPNDPKEIGLWGLPIVVTSSKRKFSESEVQPNSTTKKSGVKLGSYIENSGETDLEVKGGGKKPTAITILKPGEKMVLQTGFSVTIVTNKDILVIGKFKTYLPK